MESDRKRLDDLLDSFQAVNVELRALRVQISDLLKQLAAKDAENAFLRKELKLSRKNLYGKKIQRGCSSKKKDVVSREESKDDFDGLRVLFLAAVMNRHRQLKLPRLRQPPRSRSAFIASVWITIGWL